MTTRSRQKLKFALIFWPGLVVCMVYDNWLAAAVWAHGWVFGMEWQRVKTEIEKNQ